MTGKFIRVSGADVITTGSLAAQAREVLRKAAEIAGRNIDELADVVGYTSRDSGTKIPFVGLSDTGEQLVVSLTEESLEDAHETRLLKALHEVNHLIDIKEFGWNGVRAMYTQQGFVAVERDVELRAWRMLIDEIGADAVPAPTERVHREFLEGLNQIE